jgi:hypothetical protein
MYDSANHYLVALSTGASNLRIIQAKTKKRKTVNVREVGLGMARNVHFAWVVVRDKGGINQMSLIYCPECGHEISNSAVACPNCGRPINVRPVPVDEKVIVTHPRREGSGFPPWAFIPLGLLGVAIIAVLFLIFGHGTAEEDNRAVNIDLASRRAATPANRETVTTNIPSEPMTVTPPVTDSQSVTVPGSQTSVPAPPPEKGTVRIDAKIATDTGAPQAVRNEKFYLLDEDVETILSEAGLRPLEGQTLTNSLGLSILYPDRYADFHHDALKAINNHIKYSGTTDAAGTAQLKNVNPNSYYLFGVTRKGNGFAIWSSPVSIIPGQNAINLSPQPVTQINNSGE